MKHKNNKDGSIVKERTKLVLIKTFHTKVVRNFIKLLPNKTAIKLQRKSKAICTEADSKLFAMDIKESW